LLIAILSLAVFKELREEKYPTLISFPFFNVDGVFYMLFLYEQKII